MAVFFVVSGPGGWHDVGKHHRLPSATHVRSHIVHDLHSEPIHNSVSAHEYCHLAFEAIIHDNSQFEK